MQVPAHHHNRRQAESTCANPKVNIRWVSPSSPKMTSWIHSGPVSLHCATIAYVPSLMFAVSTHTQFGGMRVGDQFADQPSVQLMQLQALGIPLPLPRKASCMQSVIVSSCCIAGHVLHQTRHGDCFDSTCPGCRDLIRLFQGVP